MHNEVKSWAQSPGKKHMMRHLNGERLTRGEAIIAKCADCNAGYVDGKLNCQIVDCPLYPYMPYKSK